MTSTTSLSLSIRPRTADDDEALVRIYHQHEKIFTLSVEGWRFQMDERTRPEGMEPEMAVAEHDGAVIGSLYLEPSMWSATPGTFFGGVDVDDAYQRQGVGTTLWEELRNRLAARGAVKMYLNLAQDNGSGLSFAAKQGFAKTGRAERISRLTVAEANLEGYEGLSEKLGADGIEIKAMSELDESDDAFMRELHEAIQNGAQDIPSSEGIKPIPYDTWRANFLKSPEMSAHAYWVALDHGHPAGMANFQLPTPERAFNGLTVTRRSHRGRGVARGLKLRSIEWARDNGVQFVDTGNDAENARMLAINVRLGYKPLPAREEWLKEF